MPLRLCIAILCVILFASPKLYAQDWYHNLSLELSGTQKATDNFALQAIGNSLLIERKSQRVELSIKNLTAENTGFIIHTLQFASFDIESATFNPTDSILYFTADHRTTKNRLYTSSYRNQKWSAPKPMDISSDQSDDHHPYYDDVTQTLYFASRRSGGYGGLDIWCSKNNNGEWSAPKNLGAGVNTPMNEMQPTICRSDLIYTSDQDIHNAGFDLRIATTKSGFNSSISFPDIVNSSRNDLRLVQLPQNQFVLMRSDHKKSNSYEWVILSCDEEIPAFHYRLRRNDQPASYNSVFIHSVGASPNIYTSDAQGLLSIPGLNRREKFQIKLIENSEPCEFQVLNDAREILLSLTLIPGETMTLEPLDLLHSEAERWYPGDDSKLRSETIEILLPSGFSMHLNTKGEPIAVASNHIESSVELYPWHVLISAECISELPLIPDNLPLMEAEKPIASIHKTPTSIREDVWRIDRIYFNYSDDQLNEIAKSQCKIILELMLLNPDLIIEITGSADFDGSDEFNKDLGLQRAKNVQSELVKNGIPSSRVRPHTRGENCDCAVSEKQIQEIMAPVLRRVDIKYSTISSH
jgi:outer membrane protein OmpA-like peptidoglycan-associated protein